jgi:hypothetical protein
MGGSGAWSLHKTRRDIIAPLRQNLDICQRVLAGDRNAPIDNIRAFGEGAAAAEANGRHVTELALSGDAHAREAVQGLAATYENRLSGLATSRRALFTQTGGRALLGAVAGAVLVGGTIGAIDLAT